MHQFFYCIALLAVIVSPSSSQDSVRSEFSLLGEWRGSSICQVRASSCHDEESLYHIARIAEKPNWFSMRGDKIVDGKPITMGTLECRYDSAKSVLTCDLPRGVLRFTVQTNTLQGTMTLPDGTLWRKINLTKAATPKMSGYLTSQEFLRRISISATSLSPLVPQYPLLFGRRKMAYESFWGRRRNETREPFRSVERYDPRHGALAS